MNPGSAIQSMTVKASDHVPALQCTHMFPQYGSHSYPHVPRCTSMYPQCRSTIYIPIYVPPCTQCTSMYPQCRSPIYPQLPTCTPKFSFSINDHGGVRPLSTQHKRPPHWGQSATPPTTSFLLSCFPPHVGKTAGPRTPMYKIRKEQKAKF